MSLQVHDFLDKINSRVAELDALDSKPNWTKKDEARHASLLSILSAIKDGASKSEIRSWELQQLLGPNFTVGRSPRIKLSEEVVRQYRDALLNGKIPTHLSLPEAEQRAVNEAGTQSISYSAEALGGAFVPQGFSDRLYENQKAFDEIYDPMNSNVIETQSGSNFPIPVMDDLASVATLIPERGNSGGSAGQSVQTPISNIGSSQLKSYSFRSGMLIFSIELIQDSAFAFPDAFERAIALRFARGISPYLISGTGVNQPLGLIPGALAANAKVVIASGSAANTGGSETGANSIGSADLYRLFHSVDRAYRSDAVFAMNDSTLLAIDSLIDKMGRPLLNIRDGIPSLLGKRIVVCPSVPSIAPASNPVVFYNPTYFVQRRVISSPYLRLFREANGLVEAGLLAAEAFQRTDSAFLSANSNYVPAAILQSHS